MGLGHEKPGSATELLRSATRFERCSESRVAYRAGIDPDSNIDPTDPTDPTDRQRAA